MLYFLYGIVGIIQESYTLKYKDQLIESFRKFHKRLFGHTDEQAEAVVKEAETMVIGE